MTKESTEKNLVRAIVREKAREIAEGIRPGRRYTPSALVIEKIQEYFEKIGVKRVYEIEPEEDHFTVLVMPGLVMKASNSTAEKILTLGLP